jgi:hypothetical protein
MADKVSWLKKISGLKKLIRSVGPLWPEPSTELAGYGEEGPYHCGDCEYLKKVDSKDFKDIDGKGRCDQSVMIADSQVKKDDQGRPIVNIETGCCEFVSPPKKSKLVQIEK